MEGGTDGQKEEARRERDRKKKWRHRVKEGGVHEEGWE